MRASGRSGQQWGIEGICGLRAGTGMVRRVGKGAGLCTYLVRCVGRVLLASASSDARVADVFLFRVSVV